MRINPEFKKDNIEPLSEENRIQERLSILLVFAGVFGFFFKILFF